MEAIKETTYLIVYKFQPNNMIKIYLKMYFYLKYEIILINELYNWLKINLKVNKGNENYIQFIYRAIICVRY